MMNETEIRAIHNHVIEGTVRFDVIRNKQICEIRTRGINGMFDGNTRTLATSDLHQTFWTVEVKKELDRIKAKARRAIKSKISKNDDNDEVVILDDADFAIMMGETKEVVKVDKLAALRALVS
jgi:hypothetical protein